ncbi:predicted protein [Nematostella vectensis]|uniref:Kazal-like domain-containing protein n=1 Tax=Nematostella vectensis TaxID=45351 RepID=A7SPH9_NEMVE|nr:predicted protein [Nematostella vectensis]|eukprot:XP_001626493.1 predicted protein [Nematostella vectensis]
MGMSGGGSMGAHGGGGMAGGGSSMGGAGSTVHGGLDMDGGGGVIGSEGISGVSSSHGEMGVGDSGGGMDGDVNTLHIGMGDPCKDFSCQFRPHSTCIVQDGIPTCACTMQCPSLLDPVVGSDNVMYMNECLMRMSAYNFPSTTYPPTGVTSSSGEAMDVTASPSAPCNGFSCDSPPYSKCVVQNDKPTCVCQLNCPNTGQPVLASDGAQYDNECLMQLNACSANKDITVVEFLPTSGPTNPGTTTSKSQW